MTVRHIPKQEERVETGPVQFGDDWPGIFIRGDNSLYYARVLSMLLESYGTALSPLMCAELEGLRGLLESCNWWGNFGGGEGISEGES